MPRGVRLILTYHSIDSSGSVISTPPDLFRWQMAQLARPDRAVVPLVQLTEAQEGIALTFDDGLRNFAEVAWPTLRRHGFAVELFVPAAKAGLRADWDEAVRKLGPPFVLGWEELRRLVQEGVSIGSHGLSHRDLTRLGTSESRQELARSREWLQQQLGVEVATLAYPYGSCSPRLVELARELYSIGCTTELGDVTPGADPLALPRIDAYYLRNKLLWRLIIGGRGFWYLRIRKLLRRVRRKTNYRRG